MRRFFQAICAVLAVVLFSAGPVAGPAGAAGSGVASGASSGNGVYLGVATCAGSTCHGRAEGNGKVVRQDELMRWQEPSAKSGAHSRAWAVLGGKRGQQISQTLGLGDATKAPACLGCHATNAPMGQRGPAYQQGDGVGCESCHGASSGWVASHYTMTATHASNIAEGLIPLDNPAARASVCLDCHFGSSKPGQFVSHRMMAAGHPRVLFELDLFSTLQQHHDEDADYATRKGRMDSTRLWAVGQAEAVRRSVTLFSGSAGMDGIYPQFYFYDCHSCHRQIFDKADRSLTFEANPARPIPFGMPPYNDENMIMLTAVSRALAPGQASTFDKAVRNFHASMGAGRSQAQAAAARLGSAAGSLSAALSRGSYSSDSAFTVVAAIAGQAVSPRLTDYSGSVQAVMAIDTLLNAMVKQGRITVGAAAGIRGNINRAYAAVASPNTFDSSAFRGALGDAARAIGALR